MRRKGKGRERKVGSAEEKGGRVNRLKGKEGGSARMRKLIKLL